MDALTLGPEADGSRHRLAGPEHGGVDSRVGGNVGPAAGTVERIFRKLGAAFGTRGHGLEVRQLRLGGP